jgi:hypothetical protein
VFVEDLGQCSEEERLFIVALSVGQFIGFLNILSSEGALYTPITIAL